jgi:hypothetical protein
MLLAEPDQMVLFDEQAYEDLTPELPQAPESSELSGAGLLLGLALVVLSWLPIALLIWLLT